MKNDASTTVGDLKALVREFVAERRWEKYHTVKNLAASVAVEAGELLELFQWLTPEEADAAGRPGDRRKYPPDRYQGHYERPAD